MGCFDYDLVSGEHQLLARACRNIYGADFLHIYDLHRIERRGKAPVNARPHGSDIAAKPCQHAALLWADAMDAGQRDPDNHEYYGQHGPEPLAFRSAGKAAAKAFAPAPEQFVENQWHAPARASPCRRLTPRLAGSFSATGPHASIIPAT